MLEFYKVHNPKYPDIPNISGSASLVYISQQHKKISVQSIIIDSFLSKYYPNFKVDFVKIDAEGVEEQIIEGMFTTIKIHKPILTREILLNDMGSKIQEMLIEQGYEFYLPVGKEKLLKTDKIKYEENSDVRNVFCVPKEKIDWVKEFIVEQESKV